jgi:hypothetical protein
MSKEHLIREAFQALPRWQKVMLVVTCMALSPWIAFIAILTAVSLWPLFLLGRFEGEHPTLSQEVRRVTSDTATRAANYFG